MKKLFILGLGSLFALNANAQSLEERVEALEFKGYEQFFKFSGQLEMRWDAVSINNKDRYDYASDLGDWATSTITQKATVAALTAGYGAAAGIAAQAEFDAADCGTTTSAGSGAVAKNGCGTYIKDQKENATLGQVFVKLNMESSPSDKLSFYGRLSMSKYVNVNSSDGKEPDNDSAFNDYQAGTQQTSSEVWMERAFANYKTSENGVFTFGRIPTIYGAPKHLKTGEPMLGNYPLAGFASIFDGMAYTHGFSGGHTARIVYSPFQNITFDNPIVGDSKAETKADVFTVMYEWERAFSWTRKMHLIFSHSHFEKFMINGSDLTMGQDRSSLYMEMLSLGGSNFDLAFSYMQSVVNSKNNICSTVSGKEYCYGGWLSGGADEKVTGAGYGVVLRYAFKPTIKVGYEMYYNDKNAFAYDTANNEALSIYNNYGTGQRVFYVQDLAGGLKVQTDYTMLQTDYIRGYANLIGDAVKVDKQANALALRLIANF